MPNELQRDPREVLDFWFGPTPLEPEDAKAREALWFGASPATDATIRQRFAQLVEVAARGELSAWRSEARSALALVLLLDQFPRNLYRGTAQAFACDELARDAAHRVIDARHVDRLPLIERAFLILPFEHSECIEDQRECVRQSEEIVRLAPAAWRPLFEYYLTFARQHHDLIERFGRFPHRNQSLGRESTPEEVEYLRGGGATFGQTV